MTKAQPPVSFDSGGDRGGANTEYGENNKYGDDAFESEDLSPTRCLSGDELRKVEKGAKDSGSAALPAFDNNSDLELEVRWCRADNAHTAHTTGLAVVRASYHIYVERVLCAYLRSVRSCC